MLVIPKKHTVGILTLMLGVFLATNTPAADWSDTSISWGYGTKFAEPFNNQAIKKNIISLNHISGYRYGSNFFNVDLLTSDSKDPGSTSQTAGAQEAYVVYRHNFDLSKISGTSFSVGPLQRIGLTVGFDWNTKNDVGYNSRRQLLLVGPTLQFAVPGNLNFGIYAARDSNAPSGAFPPVSRVSKRHYYPVFLLYDINWGLPLGKLPLAFEGFARFTPAKGKNEVGVATVDETLADARLMWDMGETAFAKAKSLRIGIEYQYWKNKYGISKAVAGDGAIAQTPMIRVQYHF